MRMKIALRICFLDQTPQPSTRELLVVGGIDFSLFWMLADEGQPWQGVCWREPVRR